MFGLDKLTIHSDLSEVGGVVEDVFEDVAGEDDRRRPIVLRLAGTTLRADAEAVEVVRERLEAERACGVQLEDLSDDRRDLRVLDDRTVEAAIALRDDAEEVPCALEVAEVVPHPTGDLHSLLLGHYRLHLPGQLIDRAH